MLFLKTSFTLTLTLALAFAADAKHISLPAIRYQRKGIHDISKRTAVVDPASGAGVLWGTYMDVGASKNLLINVDTGSPDLAISTPNVYKPGPDSVSLNQTYTNTYDLNHTRWESLAQTDKNGCGELAWWADVYADTVNLQGIVLKNQRFTVANAVKFPKRPNLTAALDSIPPEQGVLGLQFLRKGSTLFGPTPMAHLVEEGLIDEARFGVAFGTAGKGQFVLGGVDDALFDGSLAVATTEGQWTIANVSAVVNGKAVAIADNFFLDSGGPIILTPASFAKTVLGAAGMELYDFEQECGSKVGGRYPCDDPPQIGFQLGGSVFNVEPEALRLKDDGANTCTAILIGDYESTFFTVGHPFMQGKYLDHVNHQNGTFTMGFAPLKNPADPGNPEGRWN